MSFALALKRTTNIAKNVAYSTNVTSLMGSIKPYDNGTTPDVTGHMERGFQAPVFRATISDCSGFRGKERLKSESAKRNGFVDVVLESANKSRTRVLWD